MQNHSKYLKLPKLSLLELDHIHSMLDLKYTYDKDGNIEEVVPKGTPNNMALILSSYFSFHLYDGKQLYITLTDGTYQLVDPFDIGVLIHICLEDYGIGRARAWQDEPVYNELLQIISLDYSTVAPGSDFKPLEWDGVKRMGNVLTHFFTLDDQDGHRQTWAFLTMLFQWYRVLIDAPGAGFTVAPVIMSTQQGIGKSHFVELLGSLSDQREPLNITSWNDMHNSNVTSTLPESSIIFYDEMDRSALRREYDDAKRIATTKQFVINPKYLKSYKYERQQPLVMSTNNTDVLPDDANRRFPIINVYNNPNSPLATEDIDGAKAFLQQVLNEVAYVYDHATDEERLVLREWGTKLNAQDSDDSKLELARVFNNIVLRHVNVIGETKDVTISEFYDEATVEEANILISYLSKDKEPLVEGITNIGEVINKRLYRGSFNQLLSAYNDLVSPDYNHEVISSRDFKKNGGRRYRRIDISHHKFLNKLNPSQTPHFVGSDMISELEKRQAIVDRIEKGEDSFTAAIYQEALWCPVKQSNEGDQYYDMERQVLEDNMKNVSYQPFEMVRLFVEQHPGQYRIGLAMTQDTPLSVVHVHDGFFESDFLPKGVAVEQIGSDQRLYYPVSLTDKSFGFKPGLKHKERRGDVFGRDVTFINEGSVIVFDDPNVINYLSDVVDWHLDSLNRALRDEIVSRETFPKTEEAMFMVESEINPISVGKLKKELTNEVRKIGLEKRSEKEWMHYLIDWFVKQKYPVEHLIEVRDFLQNVFPDWSQLRESYLSYIRLLLKEGALYYDGVGIEKVVKLM